MLLPGTFRISVFIQLCALLSLIVRVYSGCPKACFCNTLSKIVYCSRRGLTYIPDGIPRDSQQLNLNENNFRTPVIVRSNFSRLTSLEHLYMSECGIEVIEVDTFVDLVNLKWLDLSYNRIKEIQDYTFNGLTLQHLFLNGNRNIQLNPQSFEGLVATGLYLHDCSLEKLSVDILSPLNTTLRYLWLNGNALERVDKKFLPFFSTLSHLRLGSNPVHCNCEALWLKEFYDKNGAIFKGADPPACLTPPRLKGKYFNELSLFEFRCHPPVFNNIDALFKDNQGKLRCTATGDPAPTLYWIRPSGEARRFSPPVEEDVKKNEGLLDIVANNPGKAAMNVSGMYICVANNEAGNVTLTVNVSWPGFKTHEIIYRKVEHPITMTTLLRSTTPTSRPTPTSTHVNIPTPPSRAPPRRNNNARERTNFTALNMLHLGRRHGERLFNLTELVGAVIGTHVCTLLLCLIFMPIYFKRKCRQRHTGLEKAPHEKLYLNGLGHHSDYIDTPPPTKR